jgi:hypothetical protein
MPDPTGLSSITVSVQTGSGPAAGTHLAAGLLGDRDLVLVPDPPPSALDPTQPLDVVIIPDPLGGPFPVERLRVRCAFLLSVASERDPMVAALRLDRGSGYPVMMSGFSGPAVADQLERNGGDVWAAFESTGTIARGLRGGPSAGVLAALPDVERRQRLATYRTHVHDSARDVGFSLCRLLCICSPA